MQTDILDSQAAVQPWLEFAAPGSDVKRMELANLPFTVGRVDTCDLPLDSTRVSREHARIERHGDGTYRVRDLGSTNGTFLNGKRIRESPLVDGDVLKIADQELFFFLTRAPVGSTATQPMQGDGGETDALEMLRGVRRLSEIVMHRGMQVSFQPVVWLANKEIWGYELPVVGAHDDPGLSAAERRIVASDCRLADRFRHMLRSLAVEKLARLKGETHLLLRVGPQEMGHQGLVESLAALQTPLPADHQLVIELEHGAVSDIPYFRELRAKVREAGLKLCYRGLESNPGPLLEQAELAPDFLRIDRSLLADIDKKRGRRQQLEAVLAGARNRGMELIATGIASREDSELCQRHGCRLGQGEFCGAAKSARSLCAANESRH